MTAPVRADQDAELQESTAYLLDLASRLSRIPVSDGVDGFDIDRVRGIANALCAERDQFAAGLREARGEDWQPMATAPKDGTRVDLWDGESRRVSCRFRSDRWTQFVGYRDKRGKVPAYVSGFSPTHWMLEPKPPALAPDPHQAAGSASGKEKTDG